LALLIAFGFERPSVALQANQNRRVQSFLGLISKKWKRFEL
jgi:hypothetical protein